MRTSSDATEREVKERKRKEKEGKAMQGKEMERKGVNDAGTDYIKTVTGWKSELKENGCDESLWKDTVTRQESESRSREERGGRKKPGTAFF